METRLLLTDDDSLRYAAGLLKEGKVVGIPTETVYGLGANALDVDAVGDIFKAKGRPQDNPLIVHISDISELEALVEDIPPLARKCAESFWPGPLTMIFKKKPIIPDTTSGGLDTVGIRMPSNKYARQIIKFAGVPIAAPSANLSGSPSPTTAMHVFKDMNGRIPAIVDGGMSAVDVESTVISFEGDSIRILRPGFISKEDLAEITDNVVIDKGVLEQLSPDTVVRSPGMKYRHYSPSADVTIIDADAEHFRGYVKEHGDSDTVCLVFNDSDCDETGLRYINYGSDSKQQAQRLFDALRELDEIGAKTAYARCPEKTGVGLAVYNRLLRAAGFQVIKL
ncbi:MAG: threonylcarbamoyl-AMP synthase [Ruminococcus sp.]|nr:threonylcarbamoyl-AMP synthase [Ruminococcus sp.]